MSNYARGKRCRGSKYYSDSNGFAENMHNADISQVAAQVSVIDQESDEVIWIKDSCNIEVQTTDTQAAISLQVGLQLAIALVISIILGDNDQSQAITQNLFQELDTEQRNRQRIYIDNSKDVNITTTDTDIAVNLQVMLEVLLALVVRIDVL
ncbi:spore coat protein [Bacillus sp. FJAT-22090]|uniref:spore coat protein n=1 Tax=Bacillus sp. FJAT-22090 TaxID=1581038 RepID=UPI0011A97DAC|nr:spore coat protein [Bacillus sp. FJAT-22090]